MENEGPENNQENQEEKKETGGAASSGEYQAEGKNIEDIVSEEVTEDEQKEQNQNINQDDFTASAEDLGAEGPNEQNENRKKTTEKNPEEKPEEKKETPVDSQEAFKRQMKPKTMITFGNILLGRVGAMFSKQPKEYWKITGEDREDLEIIMDDAVAEGNFSGMNPKWMLVIVLGIILIAKIFNANKPWTPEGKVENKSEEKKEQHSEKDAEKIYAETRARWDAKNNFDKVMETLEALKEQNKLLMKIIDEKIPLAAKDFDEAVKKETRKKDLEGRMYRATNGKLYDLERISFTEKGALIDPDMAGQDGYTTEGKKQGIPSKNEKDLKAAWEMYQEQKETATV